MIAEKLLVVNGKWAASAALRMISVNLTIVGNFVMLSESTSLISGEWSIWILLNLSTSIKRGDAFSSSVGVSIFAVSPSFSVTVTSFVVASMINVSYSLNSAIIKIPLSVITFISAMQLSTHLLNHLYSSLRTKPSIGVFSLKRNKRSIKPMGKKTSLLVLIRSCVIRRKRNLFSSVG